MLHCLDEIKRRVVYLEDRHIKVVIYRLAIFRCLLEASDFLYALGDLEEEEKEEEENEKEEKEMEEKKREEEKREEEKREEKEREEKEREEKERELKKRVSRRRRRLYSNTIQIVGPNFTLHIWRSDSLKKKQKCSYLVYILFYIQQ